MMPSGADSRAPKNHELGIWNPDSPTQKALLWDIHWPISRRKGGGVAIFCIVESYNFELHPCASNRELHSQAMHPFAKSLWTLNKYLDYRKEKNGDEMKSNNCCTWRNRPSP